MDARPGSDGRIGLGEMTIVENCDNLRDGHEPIFAMDKALPLLFLAFFFACEMAPVFWQSIEVDSTQGGIEDMG